MNKIEALKRILATNQADVDRFEKLLAEAKRHLQHTEAQLLNAQSQRSVKHDGSPTFCNKCGADVSTELAFSLHYVIDDPRYPNLGHCPDRVSPPIDQRPHSRACGFQCPGHGSGCHYTCPTCGGLPLPDTAKD